MPVTGQAEMDWLLVCVVAQFYHMCYCVTQFLFSRWRSQFLGLLIYAQKHAKFTVWIVVVVIIAVSGDSLCS